MAQSVIQGSKKSRVEDLLNSAEGLEWRHVHHGKARLESTRKSSIVLAAFTFGIFSSLQLNFPSECPSFIMTMLAVNSAFLISMHSFAFIISTCILPKLEAVVEEYNPPSENDSTIKPVPEFSPHDRFNGFLEISYNISHILGLFLFLLEIALIAWVKFWDVSINACIASSLAVAPFMIAFGWFVWRFHFALSSHLYQSRAELIEDLECEYHNEQTVFRCAQEGPDEEVMVENPLYCSVDNVNKFHLQPAPKGKFRTIPEFSTSESNLCYNTKFVSQRSILTESKSEEIRRKFISEPNTPTLGFSSNFSSGLSIRDQRMSQMGKACVSRKMMFSRSASTLGFSESVVKIETDGIKGKKLRISQEY